MSDYVRNVLEENMALQAQLAAALALNARYQEALAAVWNHGVCAGELKDQVRDALWPKALATTEAKEGEGSDE